MSTPPEKREKARSFIAFSGDTVTEHWLEMVLITVNKTKHHKSSKVSKYIGEHRS